MTEILGAFQAPANQATGIACGIFGATKESNDEKTRIRNDDCFWFHLRLGGS
jgi:hypothetical protein